MLVPLRAGCGCFSGKLWSKDKMGLHLPGSGEHPLGSSELRQGYSERASPSAFFGGGSPEPPQDCGHLEGNKCCLVHIPGGWL